MIMCCLNCEHYGCVSINISEWKSTALDRRPETRNDEKNIPATATLCLCPIGVMQIFLVQEKVKTYIASSDSKVTDLYFY